MTGPCLCGDPYCGSCGDPSLAQFEAMIDELTEELGKLSESECALFVKMGRAAVATAGEAGFICAESADELAERCAFFEEKHNDEN